MCNLKLNVIHLTDFLYFYKHIITCDLDDFPWERIEMLRIMRLTVCSIHPFLLGLNRLYVSHVGISRHLRRNL